MSQHRRPFRALWAMMIGFFLIVADSTVVAVANPALKHDFGVEYHSVIWVTSAYLLAFAAFLLIGGRLGDRFGPKHIYLFGLATFTAASVWCGLSTSVGTLICARVVQGMGAALLTPQILTSITRTFPPQRHGAAMSVWGATAGVGMLAGPVLGGVLLGTAGWRWIFLINLPIGVVGLALAAWLIPALPGRRLRFDIVGVVLSGAGICLIVLGVQEGQHHDWSVPIWATIITGITCIAVFFGWQTKHSREPLIPSRLGSYRNFVLSNAGIALVSFVFAAFAIPLMIFLQEVAGLTALRAALLMAPTAIATVVLAPVVGRLVDRAHPRPLVVFGFTLLVVALLWLAVEMEPDHPVWRLALPMTLVGVAGAFTWEPLSATATRALPEDLAGAGSAVCNTARHVGGVLSSAGIAALITILLGDEHAEHIHLDDEAGAALPEPLEDLFADAMAQSMLLPACAAALGIVAAMFLSGGEQKPAPAAAVALSRLGGGTP
ncbi:MFS transporter [Mycolicibacterium parafortuitum]|uniref:MFS transporter n=1 Tax=Mycolicibacterium parafortuitum TaxID=39692 RepID=A0A7I7U645_MYCPF|nr:DHA2 family efflux MFS transporter permease subunit [Mycolicibacterium parafortuitum]BBY76371.1 MFS transporter [Mycolicibacterium parafortuitum]